MAKIQIKSETRHELSFFPNSFDDYVPKDSKVRMVDRIVRSMDINPLMDTYAGTGELREYENSLVTFKPFLDKYRKRHGKQSKCVTADSGYGSEENYEYMEMEEMVGYVKYNWFHKEQHKPFKEDVFNQANFYYNKDEDYYVCPMGQHINPCGQRQTKSVSSYASVISLYRAQRCEGCSYMLFRQRCVSAFLLSILLLSHHSNRPITMVHPTTMITIVMPKAIHRQTRPVRFLRSILLLIFYNSTTF